MKAWYDVKQEPQKTMKKILFTTIIVRQKIPSQHQQFYVVDNEAPDLLKVKKN